MITVQPPPDLPPYNEVVVIKVRLDNGHIKYRTDARDRPAFRREFRTFRYDDNGFLLNTRHEVHVIAWASIPPLDDPRWKGVVLTPPDYWTPVLVQMRHIMDAPYFKVTQRQFTNVDVNGFRIHRNDRYALKWCPLESLEFVEVLKFRCSDVQKSMRAG